MQIWCWPAGGQGQGPGDPGVGVSLLVNAPGPDTAGCRVLVFMGLVSPHWWVRPLPKASVSPLVELDPGVSD